MAKHYQEKEVVQFHRKRMRKFAFLAVCAILFTLLLAFATYSFLSADRIYANQYAAGLNLAKRNKAEAADLLRQKTGEFNSADIKLMYKSDKGEKIYPINLAEIGLHFDIDATVDQAWQIGRGKGIKINLWQQCKSLFSRTDHAMIFTYNENVLNSKLEEIAKGIDSPEKDFSLIYKNGKFSLSSDRKSGSRIDRTEIVANFKNQTAKLKKEDIVFASKNYDPRVAPEKAIARLNEANAILKQGDLILTYDTQEFKLDADTIGGLVESRIKDDDLELYFDDSRLQKFLNSVSGTVNVEPANAKLTIANGRATVFQVSRIGKTLDKEKTKADIASALMLRTDGKAQIPAPQKIALTVAVKQPEVNDADIDNLGITELVGTGTTNFKGSPANRIHNIQTGAAALNGILLKSGETFSTLAKLGEINDKSGYLPELVIKEDSTVPEFGGGLCQVSTTLFRAAMNAGMKIVERYNHSYRVSYYEPPIGMDATIYDPAPDFKFQNNYANFILVQSKVEGTKITFDFYGTKDNRVAEIGQPESWDPVDPGPPIIIETDTLPPDERKQTDHAHQGISAKFHYKVAKDGQVLQETDFISKYVPWPEKWLVGKAVTPPAEPQV